jgi:tetratricopeptide (TPR) repeat protein
VVHWFRHALPGRRCTRLVGLLVGLVVLALAGLMVGRKWWADEHLRAAHIALDRRDFADAREHLRYCLVASPHDSQVHLLAARAARRLELYDEAELHLHACQRLGDLAESVQVERMLTRVQRGNLSEESALWTRVEANDPSSVPILEVLVQEYIRIGRLDAALRGLEVLLDWRPNDLDALLGRGWVWEQLFYFPAAVQDYRRALQLDPDNDRVRLRLAQALVITGPADEAASHFERLAQRQREDAAVLLGLAQCRRQLSETDEARRLLAKILQKEPDHAAALTECGKVALDENDPREAESWLRRAVARSPFDRQANYSLGQCLRLLGKPAEAQRYETKVKAIDADLQRLNALTEAVQKSPHNADLYAEAGILFLRNGEAKKGIRWLEMALERDPWHRDSHEALAAYFAGVGQGERAAHHRRLAAGSLTP